MINEVYKLIYDQLTAFAPLAGVWIFDHVEQDYEDFPYIRIEPFVNNDNGTDTETAFSSTIQIHTWSRYRGTIEIADLQEKVYNALHRVELPDSVNYGVSGIQQEFSNIMTEPDGITRHGVQRFTVFYEPLPA